MNTSITMRTRRALLSLLLISLFAAGLWAVAAESANAGSLSNVSVSRSSSVAGATNVTYTFQYRLANGLGPGDWLFTVAGCPWLTSGGSFTVSENFYPHEWLTGEFHYYMGGEQLNLIIIDEYFNYNDIMTVSAHGVTNQSTPGRSDITIRTTNPSGATIDVGYATLYTTGAPIVGTASASSVTSTSATIGGAVTNVGYPGSLGSHGLVWGTSPNPTTSNNKIELGARTEPGGFSSGISSLTPATTYYVRAYALNSNYSIVYGTQTSFTTMPTYALSYNANGAGSGSAPGAQTKYYGVDLALRSNTGGLARTGYAYGGWNTAADGSGTTYAEGASYTANAAATLYAQWSPNTYAVTFDANGGEDATPAGKDVSFDAAYGELAETSRSGYSFNGWFTAAEGGSEVTAATVLTSAADHTLYAQWSPNTYAVTFDANGGEDATPAGKDVSFDAAYGELAETSRSGYSFNGWFTAAEGGSEVTAATVLTSAADHTLYAQWSPNTYAVTFDANGGEDATPAGKDVSFDAAYGELAETSRSGYSFNGWFTAAEGGSEVTAATVLTSAADHTLYAQWSPNTYAVTFDANGATSGTAPDELTKTYGVDLTLPNNSGALARTGYSFRGWNTAADGSGAAYAEGASYTGNEATTLYADWADIVLSVPVVPNEAGANGTFTVYGTLSPQHPAGETSVTLKLYRYNATKRVWTFVRDFATVNSDSADATKYAATLKIATKANYRFRAEMDGLPISAASKTLPVKAVATISIPKAPASAGAGKSFTVSGTLKPRFPAGQRTVKVAVHRLVSGKWVYVKTVSAINANYSTYSKYTMKTTLATKGTYRFTAKMLSSTKWVAVATAPSKTMTVK